MSENPLVELAVDFGLLSLIAVGGAMTVLPEMHRTVVDQHGWMSAATFADLFALAQAAPGPNVLFVSLIGWHVAGLAGGWVTAVTARELNHYGAAWRRFTAVEPYWDSHEKK